MSYDTFNDGPNSQKRSGGIVPHSRGEVDYYDTPVGSYSSDNSSEEQSINFWDVLRIINQRKWMIMSITLLGVSIAALLTMRVTPMFKASASIEVQRQETKIIEGAFDPSVVADDEYIATQFALIKSRSLAERIAEDLDLVSDPRYANQNASSERRLKQAANAVTRGITILPVGRSRVIRIQFESPYPQEAARLANATVDNFIQANLERKYSTTAYAREFIQERLAATKIALEESERRLVEYASANGILDLSLEEGANSLDASAIAMLNSELTNAQSARVEAEQRYLQLMDPQLGERLLTSENLTRLKILHSSKTTDYQQLSQTFKPGYPDMIALQTEINAVEADIAAEKSLLLTSARAKFDAALGREQSIQQRMNELRGNLQSLRDRRIEYTILGREVDTNRTQYDALLQRLKDVSISNALGSSQVSVVDRALTPGAPFEPNLRGAISQALILSLALGIGIAFLLNFIDDTIKTPEDVRKKLGLPTIGVVPWIKGSKDILTSDLNNPRSGISEAFLSARAALEFTTTSGAPKSLLVTSTRPAEGKTSSTVALAMSFAKTGKSVLIIDADMRKPSFVADAGASVGLSGMLTRDAELANEVVNSSTEGLYLLPAGIIPPNPAELLASPKLQSLISEAEEQFDLVVVDSPPVLSFADSPILGSICEGALVVIQSGSIRTPSAVRTVGRLMESHTNVLGTVLSKFDSKKAGYEYGYYYYGQSSKAYKYTERAVPNKASLQRKIRIFSNDEHQPPAE
ncbi:MAG: polysaccharide biosynthesis tyrosine autokinase [Pseudomonadota bacterium]